jgi:hypothetical protein
MTGRKFGNISLSVVITLSIRESTTRERRFIGDYATLWRIFPAIGAARRRNLSFRLSLRPDWERQCAALSVFSRLIPMLDPVFPKMTPVILRMIMVSHCM